jgi:hypothetical protein
MKALKLMFTMSDIIYLTIFNEREREMSKTVHKICSCNLWIRQLRAVKWRPDHIEFEMQTFISLDLERIQCIKIYIILVMTIANYSENTNVILRLKVWKTCEIPIAIGPHSNILTKLKLVNTQAKRAPVSGWTSETTAERGQ